MLGQTWKSEIRSYQDEKTGRKVRQLTSTGNNVHLYFTENSFDAHKNEIIFLSDRASGEDRLSHERPHYNLFRMDLDSGEITQISDEAPGPAEDENRAGSVHSVTKTPDSEIIVYRVGNQIRKLDTRTGKNMKIYEDPVYNFGAPSIALNRRIVAFCRNEKVQVQDGPNYTGFKERYYLVKDGRITLAYLDGSGWFDVFKDTHQVGHFQFCPTDSSLGSYCHEGPWNLVTQRIWLLDFVSREAKPCFRQIEQDSVGHEFWTQDGLIFFDNRGPGHDGTITSSRTQAVATEVAVKEQHDFIPFVGLADRDGEMVAKSTCLFTATITTPTLTIPSWWGTM
jgi:oligogalacturonide lyase